MNSVVLFIAGGSGTRFWPVSKRNFPKQYIKLFFDKSFIEMSYERVIEFVGKDNIFFILPESQKGIFFRHMPYIKKDNVIIEPFGNDTATAVAYATLRIKQNFNNTIVYVMPSDHVIKDKESFYTDLKLAKKYAEKNLLVTFGINPSFASTEYGYIEVNKEIERNRVFKVTSFREKPRKSLAEEFLKKGNFFWNSGIFVWTTETILEAFSMYATEIIESLNKYEPRVAYSRIKPISIDYAILEKAQNIVLLKASFDWDDVGQWESVGKYLKKDEYSNAVLGNFYSEGTENIISINRKGRNIVIGLKDVVVVKEGDDVLVMQKGRSKSLKNIVKNINKEDEV